MGISSALAQVVPATLRYTVMLQFLGFLKIPLIFFIRPRVVIFDDQQCVLKVSLRRRVKNHLNSMYFGALAIAAECAGGVAALKAINDSGKAVSLVFKDFSASFIKRADSDTYFTCKDVAAIQALIADTIQSGERRQLTFAVIATCPDRFGEQPVANFQVTVSVKHTLKI
ncbi:MAG: DUF4442 domain-containing protein [Pseudomonadota bacterium]